MEDVTLKSMITKRKGRVSVTTGVHYDEDTYTTAMRVLFNIAKSLDILTVKIQLITAAYGAITSTVPRASFGKKEASYWRSLNPQIERVLKEEPSSTTLCSNTFEIRTEDNTLVSIFLRFLRPKCRLVIFCHGIIDLNKIFLQTSFFDSDIVRAARDIFVDVRSGITDDQVTKLQAPTFRINSPYLSAWSINKLILLISSVNPFSNNPTHSSGVDSPFLGLG
ncbi:hypothetical protein Y032_0011g1559 [Ancylostoma ceylanicum]|uniref:Uncharacterized protein n=2 Tax=Ancylostoma ceylanicum TaxID=53326 RepID=A0A016VH84_9BILA|nr:hypothetical protein Y032_0011g1559 [Ancylostoma ceylanicum]